MINLYKNQILLINNSFLLNYSNDYLDESKGDVLRTNCEFLLLLFNLN